MSQRARRSLLFLPGICTLLLVAAGAWNGCAYADRIMPEKAQLVDPEMVGYCRDVQAALVDGRFDQLEAQGRDLISLHDRMKGGIEKLRGPGRAILQVSCSTRSMPSMRMGTTGIPSFDAIIPTPGWNRAISPARVILPSGKMSRHHLSLESSPMYRRVASAPGSRCGIGKQLKNSVER